MEYFLVRYNSRVVNYDCRGFIRLATDVGIKRGAIYFKKIPQKAARAVFT